MHDITDVLAFEVKKELADRYFGFRRKIESDTAAYRERLTISALELENTIGIGLVRIYILLHDKDLITRFLQLIGLPTDLFYDPYLLESPTIKKRVFTGIRRHGITKKGQLINLLVDSYAELVQRVEEYRRDLDELEEEQQTIREEINLFYRKNDIDTILSFIRRLDHPGGTTLDTSLPPDQTVAGPGLSDQLRLSPPRPAGEVLPALPSLPPPKAIHPELKKIAKIILTRNPSIDLKNLSVP